MWHRWIRYNQQRADFNRKKHKKSIATNLAKEESQPL